MRTGFATLPLHRGRAPRWLLERMRRLAAHLVDLVVEEHGRRGLLRRLSDPGYFQALGTLLGYDWHSSGVTTVLTAVLKTVVKPREHGVAVCGGKGGRSLRTPMELRSAAGELGLDPEPFVRLSRLVAKVDNTLVQDGFQLYHHAFIVTEDGDWAVVQQGMDTGARLARRYHWFGPLIENPVEEPHSGFFTRVVRARALNMVARESRGARETVLDLVREGVSRVRRDLMLLRGQGTLTGDARPPKHLVMGLRVDWSALERAYELQPSSFEELVLVRGVGPRTVRALALVASLVYGSEVSWRDPAAYGFAVGGKDGVPFPVDKRFYDELVEYLAGLRRELGDRGVSRVLARLARVVEERFAKAEGL